MAMLVRIIHADFFCVHYAGGYGGQKTPFRNHILRAKLML